jgi:homoserine dehydrogenase
MATLRSKSSEPAAIAIIGFGSVSRALIELLNETADAHRFRVTGIHRRSGTVTGDFDARRPEFGPPAPSAAAFLDAAQAEILVELSTLNPETGEPATSHIREALRRGMHVVTANKGPIAHSYHLLAEEAKRAGVRLLCESAVMDGAPVFNLFRHNLAGVKLLGFSGVLNSTSNLVIEAMESGGTFEEGVRRAQAAGIAEENFAYDTEGWDSAAKTAALANVLMDARVTPLNVIREGIHGFSVERIRGLAAQGQTIRLVSRASRVAGRLALSVGPEILPKTDLLASVTGTSNLILFHTDRMGTIGTVSIDPGVKQTAYGVYIDLREIAGTDRRLRGALHGT